MKSEKELESLHKVVRLTDESHTGLSPQGLLLLVFQVCTVTLYIVSQLKYR